MSEALDSLGLHARLRKACEAAGSQKAWAARHGVSAGHVNDVLNDRKPAGPAVLAALGLRKVVRYVERRASPEAVPPIFRARDVTDGSGQQEPRAC